MAASDKKTGPVDFIRQVKSETKKVTWPSRKETTVSTIMVFIMVTIAAIFLFFTDQIVATIIRWILG
jgi:preprotein translocase subunit SecE